MTLAFSGSASSCSRAKVRLIWALLAVLSVAGTAAAQPVDATMRTAARELATQGAEAFDRKEFGLAYDRLKRAFDLYPVPTISYLEAKCLVELGRLVEALDLFEETRRMPVLGDAPEAFREATRAAAAETDLLRPRIPRLLVQARRGGTVARDVTIRVDGKLLPKALLEVDCPVDPGPHTVTVAAPNSATVTRQVTILEKERVVLEVALDIRSAYSSESVPGKVQSDDWRARRLWGWGALGASAAGLVGTVITGKVALDAKSHLDTVCSPGCPRGSGDEIERFRTYRTVSYVAAGATAALAGVGGYLLFVRPSSRGDTTIGLSATAVNVAVRF